MRRPPLLPAALLALTTLTSVLGFTSAADAATIRYVALGDSYSSGTGASSGYLDATCKRSASAYPYLYSQEASPASFSFKACTGATTTDVVNSQLSTLSSTTTLVSITIGGNDVGFSNVMTTCVLQGTTPCTTAVNTAKSTASSALPGLLNTVYTKIRAKAPNARVVVLGYPVFYNLAKDSTCIGLNTTKRTAINGAAVHLNNVISTAVSAHSGFVFRSVVSGFSGHQLCDSVQWIHALEYPIVNSYHPTAAGHSGAYLPRFKAGI